MADVYDTKTGARGSARRSARHSRRLGICILYEGLELRHTGGGMAVHITDWRLERSWMQGNVGSGSGVDLFSSLEHGN
jgi:hypothetical protein